MDLFDYMRASTQEQESPLAASRISASEMPNSEEPNTLMSWEDKVSSFVNAINGFKNFT